jgi:hypothetical protein
MNARVSADARDTAHDKHSALCGGLHPKNHHRVVPRPAEGQPAPSARGDRRLLGLDGAVRVGWTPPAHSLHVRGGAGGTAPAADGGSADAVRLPSAKSLSLFGWSASDPDVRGAVSAPCRRAAADGIPEGRAHRFPTIECAARVLEPGRDTDPRPARKGRTRIARGTAERHDHERLQIFEPIPDAAAYLDEPRADAAIAPALQRFHRHIEQRGRLFFIQQLRHRGAPSSHVFGPTRRPV